MDAIDEILLWELARNARITNSALAEIAGIAPSTCHNRVKAMQDAGVIQSYHAQIDLEAIGFPVQALVSVNLRAQAREDIRTYAQRAILLPQVLNLFFIGGQHDFLIHVACTSTRQLRDFVATRLSMDPAVAGTQTNIVFDHMLGHQHMDHVSGLTHMRRSIEDGSPSASAPRHGPSGT
ncbi:Lrp/AsnC family transcriptional regulator [Streptomyces sp. NPDC004610]|uniref:Lrp/AsnC family transcriptional regulator n=1 Tax=unclassified Streptomyces TaxID=2593676 RepID=UPI0033B0D42E